MSPRVSIEASRLKIGKAGYDITTCGAAGWIFNSDLGDSLGTYLTGTGTVPGATTSGHGETGQPDAQGETVIYFSQPAGTVPLAFVQSIEGAGVSWGGGYRHVSHAASDPEWANPYDYDVLDNTYGYSGTPSMGVVFAVGTGQLYVENFRKDARGFRYLIFFARLK